MFRKAWAALVLVSAIALVAGQPQEGGGKAPQQPPPTAPPPPSGKNGSAVVPAVGGNKIISYYNYLETGIQPWEIPGDQITHLIWSFANIHRDGTVTLQPPPGSEHFYVNAVSRTYQKGKQNADADDEKCDCSGNCLRGELYQLFRLKQRYPHLKVLLSVGGWVWSTNFSDALSTPESRTRVVQSATALMEEFGFFDGLDLDWEFPNSPRPLDVYPDWKFRPEDISNLAEVSAEFKKYWASKGHADWLMTAAVQAYVTGDRQQVKKLSDSVDFMLGMFYEYQHNDVRTRPGAPLFSDPSDSDDEKQSTVSSGVKTYTDAGVPNDKLILGVPLYGVGWTGLDANGPFRDNIPGFGFDLKKGGKSVPAVAYNTLTKRFSEEKNWQKSFDSKRVTDVFFNGKDVWFMDNPGTVKQKVEWLQQQKLGGVMMWNSNQDRPEPELSLTAAISKAYPPSIDGSAKSKNVCVQKSNYCNLDCSTAAKPPKKNGSSPDSSSAAETSVASSLLASIIAAVAGTLAI